uniref:Uncharacterized protein n=1 Tax=Rhizophora mucronata TaxID=61149 RepID=A0A2P2MXQ8_RHIMU
MSESGFLLPVCPFSAALEVLFFLAAVSATWEARVSFCVKEKMPEFCFFDVF